MIKSKTTYYTGELNCQFSTGKSKKLGSTPDLQSFIALEPRFRFYHPKRINESEVPDQLRLSSIPHVRSQKSHLVEFYFDEARTPEEESAVIKSEEIILLLDKEAVNNEQDKIFLFENYLKPGNHLSDFYKSFHAFHGKNTHGKIHGAAILKVVEYVEVPDPVVPPMQETLPPQDTRIDMVQTDPNDKVTVIGEGGTVPAGGNLLQNKGCLSIPALNSGCFSLPNFRQMGCLLPLLLLLLAGLLYSLFFRDQNGSGEEKIVEKIIHDTIKVEVIKERVDTLRVSKVDTVSYMDSTVTRKYETVSLPNVQYYTNSDVLLPSSAKDLQQLAEYLIKNDTLTATIFGHTDNVGDHNSNMKLSQRRAESVKKFLASLGVDASRMKAVGMGDTQPKADNNNEEGRLMNRRVEVKLENTEQSKTKRTKLNN